MHRPIRTPVTNGTIMIMVLQNWPGCGSTSPAEPGEWPADLADPSTPVARTAAQVSLAATAIDDLAELEAQVSVCRACPRLVAWREQVATTQRRAAFAHQPYWGRPVPGFGDDRPRIVIIGLAPAAHGGNRTGRMFTGDRSGDWLFAALHRAGYASVPHSKHRLDGQRLTGVRITAPVHCAPPGNRPTPTERDTCAPWLDRELHLVQSTVRAILALGSFGWDATLASAQRLGWGTPRPKPRFGHGQRTTLTMDGRTIELVGCYHVSQQNTFTGKLTAEMLDEVIGSLG